MRDEIESRLWVEHGDGWSNFVHDVAGGIADVMRRLHRIEFDAPWRQRPKQEH